MTLAPVVGVLVAASALSGVLPAPGFDRGRLIDIVLGPMAGDSGDGLGDGAAEWVFLQHGKVVSRLWSIHAGNEGGEWRRYCPPTCGYGGTIDVEDYRDRFVSRLDCSSQDGAAVGHMVWAVGLALPVTGCGLHVHSTDGGLILPATGYVRFRCTVEYSFQSSLLPQQADLVLGFPVDDAVVTVLGSTSWRVLSGDCYGGSIA